MNEVIDRSIDESINQSTSDTYQRSVSAPRPETTIFSSSAVCNTPQLTSETSNKTTELQSSTYLKMVLSTNTITNSPENTITQTESLKSFRLMNRHVIPCSPVTETANIWALTGFPLLVHNALTLSRQKSIQSTLGFSSFPTYCTSGHNSGAYTRKQ